MRCALRRFARWLNEPVKLDPDKWNALSVAFGKAWGGWNLRKPPSPPKPLPLDHPVRRWREGAPKPRPTPRWVVIVYFAVAWGSAALTLVLLLVFGPL